ncbi:hypothetical protein GGI43DRAFT_70843 [Trichoderma evansii]
MAEFSYTEELRFILAERDREEDSPPSPPSSSRTITPPEWVHLSQRASSSATKRNVSMVATPTTSASQAESSVEPPAHWPLGLPDTASFAPILLRDHHHGSQYHSHHQRRHQGVVSPVNRDVISGVDFSSLELPSPAVGRIDEESLPLQFTVDVIQLGRQRAHHAAMHGAILLLQSCLAIVMVALFVYIAMWEDEGESLGDESSNALQIIRLIVVCIAFALPLGTFFIHAILLLTEVVLIYFQAAILLLTAASATFVYLASTQLDDSGLQFIILSMSILSSGLSVLAFIIAVVMWMAIILEKKSIRAQYRLE